MIKKPIEEIVATGRRKTAVASVRIRSGGKGEYTVNGRPMTVYFPTEDQRLRALAPLRLAGLEASSDLMIRVKGGGIEGQVEAVRLGLSRALVGDNEKLHSEFKALGYLTRDPRKRERKKYGLAGARKRFQFSKR